MINYKEYKVVSIEAFEEFLTKRGFNPELIWKVFCDTAENDSYNFWDLDKLGDAIECEEYYEHSEAVELLYYVKNAIRNNEIPEEFLLNVYW